MTNGIVNMMYVLQRLGVTVLLAAVLSAASLSPLQAQEASVNCDSGGQGLQKKIDSASHGAKLFISGACTDGPFVIVRDLELIGSGSATLSRAGGNVVLHIQRASVVLRNLSIDANGTDSGIVLVGASVLMEGVVVEGAGVVGVDVIGNTWADIRDSEIRNSGGFAGINIRGSSGVDVTGSTIEDNNNAAGINVGGNSFAIIGENVIDGNKFGIIVTDNSSIFLRNNTITNNTQHGLFVTRHGSVKTLLPANTFAGNLGVDVRCLQRGILVFDDGPQLPFTGTTAIDEISLFACQVFGTIF